MEPGTMTSLITILSPSGWSDTVSALSEDTQKPLYPSIRFSPVGEV
jgi:hypothetical protein